jgi:pSer/pThr/pTyr-binding forkhead associated (FHA) protein
MAFQLVISEGKEAGREFLFDQASIVIGRTPECDVILYDSGVSRRHARIFDDGDGPHIEDLGSANGTLVNGARISKTPLCDGDAIVLGPVKFTFTALGDSLPPEEGTDAGKEEVRTAEQDVAGFTRVVDPAEIRRSRNKGVAMLPKGTNRADREMMERRSTQMIQGLAMRSKASALGPQDTSDESADEPSDSNAALAPVSSSELSAVTAKSQAERLTAADRARLRREGAAGAAKLFWYDSSLPRKVLVVGSGAAFLVAVLVLFVSVMIPEEKKKAPEATELGDLPVEQIIGFGKDVQYERVDQKSFDFFVQSPVEVMVVLHYQCADVSEQELSINVNGTDMGFAPADTLATAEVTHELLIPSRIIQRKQRNTIVFDNTRNPPGKDPWRIWNVWVEVTVLPEKDEAGLKADANDRFKRGEAKWDQRDIGASNRWEAYKAFREAWLTFEALPAESRGPVYQLARDKMLTAQHELDAQCNRLLMQARGEFNQGKYEAASATLDWIEKFFPTKAHPCQYRALNERADLGATLE